MSFDVTIPVGDDVLSWTVSGDVVTGPAEVLLDGDDDLTGATSWHAEGFEVVELLSHDEWLVLREGVTRLVATDLATLGHRVPAEFRLEDYHELVRSDDEQRAFAAVRNSYFPIEHMPLGIELIERRLSKVLGATVRTLDPREVPASFGVRIVRPGSGDANPPHRDAWIDRLRNSITLYLPLAGSTERSSLALVPGSHRWPECDIERTREGGVVDGVRFSVPAVVGSSRALRMCRPNPSPGEALVFSPYLIHGGSKNLEPSTTRVSLELRFERAPG